MNRLTRITVLMACLIAIIFLVDYDGLAIEHSVNYGWIMRGTVWLLIASIGIYSYENLKSIFVKEF